MQGRKGNTPITGWHKIGAVVLGILSGYLLGAALMETVDLVSPEPRFPHIAEVYSTCWRLALSVLACGGYRPS
jgi:hypothetical protein